MKKNKVYSAAKRRLNGRMYLHLFSHTSDDCPKGTNRYGGRIPVHTLGRATYSIIPLETDVVTTIISKRTGSYQTNHRKPRSKLNPPISKNTKVLLFQRKLLFKKCVAIMNRLCKSLFQEKQGNMRSKDASQTKYF